MDMPGSVPFGDLIKAFRKQKRVSQQELAVKLGIHYNTLSKWERGMCLPDSKGMVLELAKELHLAEQETRLLLEASLTALSPHWSVPYPRNPFFTGRTEILETLHMHLGPDQTNDHVQSYALRGLGGVGKTQLALEYAYRYALEYSAIFWIGAETLESITSSLLNIAEVLQLPGRDDKDPERVIAAVQRWLSSHRQWLLIWDNLEDLSLLQHFLPCARQGAILLTTRQQALGTFAQGIDLFPMSQEEGRLFLLRRAKMLEPEMTYEQMQQFAADLPTEYAAASVLVTVMAGLPLALDQAGAYIEESGCGLAVYLQRYKQQHVSLLERRGLPGKDHPYSVATTFRLASERMKQEPQASALLKVCVFLHAEAIPEELFIAGATYLGPELAPLAADLSQLDQAIASLRGLSLVQRQAKTRTLSLHRLVQTVLREQMDEAEQMLWLKRASRALNAVFPEAIYEVWEQCERLLPHALAVTAAIQDQASDQTVVELLRKAAGYLRARAQYKQAEPLYQRALRIGEQALGPAHHDMVFSLNGLALLYAEQGKNEQAELLHRQALYVGEQTLGPMHPDIAQLMNGLATLYWKEGKYEQAKALYEQALCIREAALGGEHPEITALLNGLALLYIEQGEDELAKSLCWRSLHIWERVLEVDYPELFRRSGSLAARGVLQGKEEWTLHLWEQKGAQYAHVAYPLYGLATLFAREGRDELAVSFYRCALRIGELALGSEHPNIVYPLNGLANLYLRQEKYELAEPLYQRALRIRERRFGRRHPETAQTLHDLAVFYRAQGKIDEALSFAKRALEIYSRSLGTSHPKTATTRTIYAQMLQEQPRSERKSPALQNGLKRKKASSATNREPAATSSSP